VGRHLLRREKAAGPSNIDGAAGAVEEIARIVAQIRARWPHTRIISARRDFGLCARNGA